MKRQELEYNKTMQELRKERKLTQEQVSVKTGLSIRYISFVEKGKRNLSDKSKNVFAKAYNVPPVQIFLSCQRTNRSQKRKVV